MDVDLKHQPEEIVLLASAIENICESGEDRFDTIGFTYIQGLYKRSLLARSGLQEMLLEKVTSALNVYRSDLDNTRARVEALIKDIDQNNALFEQAQALVTRGDFKSAEKLLLKTNKPINSQSYISPLLELVSQASIEDIVSHDKPMLEDHLHRHEQALLSSLLDDDVDIAIHTKGSKQPEELKSLKRFRKSWKKRTVEKRIASAIQSVPENPGPLNSHMLATRALSRMQELSPEYLDRFLVYIDTLFWLEQVSASLLVDNASEKPAKKKRSKKKA